MNFLRDDMKSIIHKLLLLVCLLLAGTAWGQSVILTGTSAGNIKGTGAGNIGGYIIPDTFTNYCDGRFTVWNTNQDVVVANDAGGKMWVRDVSGISAMAWAAASNFCATSTIAGYSDWRLPDYFELGREGATNGLFYIYETIPALPTGHPFIGIVVIDQESSYYWTDLPGTVGGYYFWYSAYNGFLTEGLGSHYTIPVRP